MTELKLYIINIAIRLWERKLRKLDEQTENASDHLIDCKEIRDELIEELEC